MPHLNLAHQRKRARALLKGAHAHDADALRRFQRWHANALVTGASLHQAQFVVARELGFASWTKLKAHVRADSLESPLMRTALLAAANRARETELANPLYRDPLAGELATDLGRSLLANMRQASWPSSATGPDPYLSIVTRFFDEALQRVVRESGITQVVLVGAELDTRAFRLDWPSGVTIFEVDRGALFEHKETSLERTRARAMCARRTVQTGLRESWRRGLLRAGFDSRQRAAFLIERTQYFDTALAARLLDDITALASPGSWIGLTLLSQDTLQSTFMTPFLRKLQKLGLPSWRFGVDDPDAWLATRGWQATTVVAGAPEASYGRWPFTYVPRDQKTVMPRAFLTQAWTEGA